MESCGCLTYSFYQGNFDLYEIAHGHSVPQPRDQESLFAGEFMRKKQKFPESHLRQISDPETRQLSKEKEQKINRDITVKKYDTLY